MAGIDSDKRLPSNKELRAELLEEIIEGITPKFKDGTVSEKELVDAISLTVGGLLKTLAHSMKNLEDPKVIATCIGILVDKRIAIENQTPTMNNRAKRPGNRADIAQRIDELKKKGEAK